ncbi:hypothetical protein [Bradyrhizobium sp. 930_D9_N1_4]|uniref:hypothetical protein n=1 Tax=Bradyrhizobium sp. 930_D9_N1_4 TaxID=3240374 RepID=UPI003F889137
MDDEPQFPQRWRLRPSEPGFEEAALRQLSDYVFHLLTPDDLLRDLRDSVILSKGDEKLRLWQMELRIFARVYADVVKFPRWYSRLISRLLEVMPPSYAFKDFKALKDHEKEFLTLEWATEVVSEYIRSQPFRLRAGGETQETPPSKPLRNSIDAVSTDIIITELQVRGVSAETTERIREEISDKGRPRWNDDDLPKEFRGISAPAFLKLAWRDILGRKMTISKQRIRRYDEPLLKRVESYISKRVGRDADLGDASGITFVLEENRGHTASPRFRKARQRDLKPA